MSDVAVIPTAKRSQLASGYTSITSTDMDTKKKVFIAVTQAESLKANLGKKITVVDVLTQPMSEEKRNEKTGEITLDEYTRITLIADDGKAYAASSTGVLNSLETAFQVFGPPSEWGDGLTFIPREEQSPNNKMYKFVTLDLAV